jgi:hypothetical protein
MRRAPKRPKERSTSPDEVLLYKIAIVAKSQMMTGVFTGAR